MRVLWVALLLAASFAGCTEVPQVQGWPCVEPHERKAVSATFAFDEGRPVEGQAGGRAWRISVADACRASAPTATFGLFAKPSSLDECQPDHVGTQLTLTSTSEAPYAYPTYYNGASADYLASQDAYLYASSVPDAWFGPAGYTDKPIDLVAEVTAWHPDTQPGADGTPCLESMVDSVTLTIEYLPLKDVPRA